MRTSNNAEQFDVVTVVAFAVECSHCHKRGPVAYLPEDAKALAEGKFIVIVSDETGLTGTLCMSCAQRMNFA